MTSEAIPLSLYIHIPWCVRRCPYCDFNSHAVRGPIDQDGYVDALLLDLDFERTDQPLSAIESIFIGGGTPSLFEGRTIARLLDGVAQRLALVCPLEVQVQQQAWPSPSGPNRALQSKLKSQYGHLRTHQGIWI